MHGVDSPERVSCINSTELPMTNVVNFNHLIAVIEVLFEKTINE